MDQRRPNWVRGEINLRQLQDEAALINFGYEDETNYLQVKFDAPRPSAMDTFPTDGNSKSRYKFSGFSMFFGLDLEVTERSTYGILSWLGDIGGLFDALYLSLTAGARRISRFG